jgi:NADPH:quinone reductase-like Zn-dependent oxidoreductase
LGVELGQRPGPQRRFQLHGVDPLQDAADGRLVRRHRAHPERGQHDAAGVVGVLGDRGERPRPGQHRARRKQQHREHTVAHPARLPRVRHLRQASTSDNTAASVTGAALTASCSTSRCSRAATIGDTDSAGTGFLT